MIRPSRFSIDHLWIITVLALVWFFLSITPLPPNDLWWHMAAGRTMVNEGALITTNRWAYTLPTDAPYVYQSWLSELVMYGVWWLGDAPLLALARTVTITLSYGLVAWHALRRTDNGKATTIALLLALLAGWSNWTLRPQTLALPLGAAFLVVLSEYLDRRASARWLLALPLLMVVWVNTHGSFALGLVLVGLAWLGRSWSALRGDVEARAQLRSLTFAAAATGLAVLVNPLGISIGGYVGGMLANPALQAWFVEWQPPRNSFDLANPGFWCYAILLLLAVLMARNPRRPSAVDLLWYVALSWLAIGGVRYVMWYGLLLLPLLASQFGQFLPQRPAPPTLPLINRAMAGLGILLLVVLLPWFEPARYLGPDMERYFTEGGNYPLLLGNTTPIQASEWLAANPIEGRFWTDMSYSSYTIWQLPEKQVFADLRVELFPQKIWQAYFDIARGDNHSLEQLDRWQITHLLLDQNGQQQLYNLLERTPGWCELYRDAHAVIVARCP